MNSLTDPLNDAELNELDEFLLYRFPEDIDDSAPGDEGAITLSELDGFLTAIVSGPEIVLPSVWLPAVWGDYPPAWESDAQLMHVMNLMMRHLNTIAWMLMNVPEEYEPLIEQREIDGNIVDIPDDWCEGYMRAVRLNAADWERGGELMDELLAFVRDFCEESGWEAHNFGEEQRALRAAQVTESVRDIHAFWLARRSPPQPQRYEEPSVGRNDPCPCGSGRKYKKCCLQ